ncbi:hexosaminidase D isoform X2 [Orussus abietinus]|uniref:hexosaminidase D isoform X2 n=1 Tax=Orussus abietinus TaxID=222816 RepID=UPI000626BE42|nr:hexosaminidase D isoform X2 [Orussus abietinus]
MMTRLRGKASLIIILTIIFLLLVAVYHILTNEIDDVPSSKRNVENHNLQEELTGGNARNVPFRSYNYGKAYNTENPLFKGHKIVHLDLKGAPPKIGYYDHLFPLLCKLGATGILIEYEDTFPFDGPLSNISASNSYSKQDIITIQRLAKANDLIVIPLIQTFGHLEFILKLDKYKDLREVFRYPQVICPTHNESFPLITEMIDQVVMAHPDSQYLHIGADEVYQLGECSRCLNVLSKRRWSKKHLFLDHVSTVARYITQKYPKLTVLMWDDEFREISSEEIMESGLNELIEPVVWKYTTDPGASLADQLQDSYSQIWPAIWIATAFKGATAPDRYYTDISYHLENHRRWLEIIDRYSDKIKFKGAILTGWQRYDHFSVLCELLPSALPSLAVNLAMLQSSDLSGFYAEVPDRVTQTMKCEGTISLNIPEPQYGWTKCDYEGVAVYAATLRLFLLNQEWNKLEQDSAFKGWLKEYNIKHMFSSPSHVEHALGDLNKFRMETFYIEKEMRVAMEMIYDNFTIEEWIETFITPLNDKITNLWEAKEKLLEQSVWPRRPLTKAEL